MNQVIFTNATPTSSNIFQLGKPNKFQTIRQKGKGTGVVGESLEGNHLALSNPSDFFRIFLGKCQWQEGPRKCKTWGNPGIGRIWSGGRFSSFGGKTCERMRGRFWKGFGQRTDEDIPSMDKQGYNVKQKLRASKVSSTSIEAINRRRTPSKRMRVRDIIPIAKNGNQLCQQSSFRVKRTVEYRGDVPWNHLNM